MRKIAFVFYIRDREDTKIKLMFFMRDGTPHKIKGFVFHHRYDIHGLLWNMLYTCECEK